MDSKEIGVTIRQPATANLMVDSADRVGSEPWYNFLITKNRSIMNGFFTRIGLTEMVLEWNVPNVRTGVNDTITVSIDGGANFSVTMYEAFYTVEQLLDAMVAALNAAPGAAGYSFSVDTTSIPGSVCIACETSPGAVATPIEFIDTPLSEQLLLLAPANPIQIVQYSVDLRPYRYLDFTSQQLTYCQNLKDANTAPTDRDVLLRWYFADDDTNIYDAYGFPILQGYRAFRIRRLFNPPKYIKWDNIQPIGQLGFQVYDPSGNLLTPLGLTYDTNFLMTLQVTEN